MEIKASLHLHTGEDAKEGYAIDYSVFDVIDYASEYGFNALALTSHRRYVYRLEYGEYALKKGVLLIPSIELDLNKGILGGRDVLVLNAGPLVEKIKNFEDLAAYRKNHPEIFVIAPHPGYGFFSSLGYKNLLKYKDLFDAFEHCWFYTRNIDLNRKTIELAERLRKPLVATADAHTLKYLSVDYLIAEAENNSVSSIFDSIRKGRYTNYTSPKSIRDLFSFYIGFEYKYLIRHRNRYA
jgi:predicted metal-dependent phosphoesterase TrpH